MKPKVSVAMQTIINETRAALPFGASDAQLCSDNCQGCSKKLLEFLDSELDNWEHKLHDGVQPNFGDIHRMGKTCKKVYMVLKNNGLIEDQKEEQ